MKFIFTYSIALIIFLPCRGFAQKYNNVWAFGTKAGLDFNTTPPTPIATAINQWEGCASVADKSTGKLLFYTDGSTVWNANNQPMPNGVLGITSSSATQAALIAPNVDSPDKYYVFSLEDFSSRAPRLFYSVVDMSLDSGRGDVEPNQRRILLADSLSESMAAVTTGCDNYWLLVHARYDRVFKAFRISPAGINPVPVISVAGSSTLGMSIPGGIICAAPDGSKITFHAQSGAGGDWKENTLTLFDFDRNTGVVSNPVRISTRDFYGVCFSADNSKLYATTQYSDHRLYQYDISSGVQATIQASEVDLGATPGNRSALQRGPDDKIYMSNGNFSTKISVINFPNLSGTACNYMADAITLASGTFTQLGLPNLVPYFTNFAPGDTTTTVSFLKNCFNGNGLVLRAADTNGWDYTWNDGTTGKFHTVNSSGIWWLSYVNHCVYQMDTFQVHVIPLPEIVTDMSCKGDSNGKAAVINAPGDSTLFTYTWMFASDSILRGPLQSNHGDTLNNAAAGKYLLKISSPEGCDTLLVLKIPEQDFQAAFDVSDTLVCLDNKVTFQNTSKGLNFFQWNFGDGGNTTLGSPQHSFSEPGSYTVQLIGQSTDPPCYDTVEKTIIVDPKVPDSFQITPDSICVGAEAVVLIPKADSITTTGLHWDFGDGNEMEHDIGEYSVSHAYDIAGNLRVTLTTHFRACPDTSFTKTVYVYPLPNVYLGQDDSLCLHGAPILLTNQAKNTSGIYHYLWSTGDTTATLKAVHQGIYKLKVSAEPLSCSNTASLKIAKDCYIDIPNAFTPNGDGENDYFFPRQLLGSSIASFKMQVFNRWGEMIFETTKINGRGWDGKFNGKPQPEGVYVYLVDAEIGGMQEHYQGNVTLLR